MRVEGTLPRYALRCHLLVGSYPSYALSVLQLLAAILTQLSEFETAYDIMDRVESKGEELLHRGLEFIDCASAESGMWLGGKWFWQRRQELWASWGTGRWEIIRWSCTGSWKHWSEFSWGCIAGVMGLVMFSLLIFFFVSLHIYIRGKTSAFLLLVCWGGYCCTLRYPSIY